MSHKNLRIALLPDSGSHWIAGVLYVQAVSQALSTVPKSKRPETHLLIRENLDGTHYTTLRESVTSTQVFNYSSKLTRLERFKKKIRPFLKKGPSLIHIEDSLRKTQADLLFPCGRSLGAKFCLPWIGWIPDFQHKHLPELFSAEELQTRDQEFQLLIDEAAHIVVSSQDAYNDLLHYFQAPPEKVSVFPFRTHADPDWFTGSPLQTAEKYKLPEKFLMFPSQFWQHKNHLTLLQAIALMNEHGDENICLVLTGKDQDYRKPEHPKILKRYIADHGLETNIRYLGLLPRQDQIHLMRRACAIVQPSHFEGWSMLVEDCRTLGKTTFLSDIPVHREQAYERAHYFDPKSAESLAQLLADHWSSLAAGPNLKAELQAQEENHSLTQDCGRQLMDIFRKTLAK